MIAKAKTGTTQARLMKALGHPLRQRILLALNEHEASPTELARRFDLPLQNVAYHIKILREANAIELARTSPVRGAVEHFYRATSRAEIDDEHWSELPLSVRRSLFDKTIDEIWQNLVAASAFGGLDDPQTHVSWLNLDLDQETYQEIVELLAETLDQAMELQAKAANKRASSPTPREAKPTQVAILHYGRPPQPPAWTVPK
jgi:DNA-binding transcriptional ArsR family regulator